MHDMRAMQRGLGEADMLLASVCQEESLLIVTLLPYCTYCCNYQTAALLGDALHEPEMHGMTAIGIQHALILPCCAGPGKTVVLVDEAGTEEEWEFGSKRAFELWAAKNTLTLSPKGGRKKCINTWEQLEDGGRYYTSQTLEKTVGGLSPYGTMVHSVSCVCPIVCPQSCTWASAATWCTSVAWPLWGPRAPQCPSYTGSSLLYQGHCLAGEGSSESPQWAAIF